MSVPMNSRLKLSLVRFASPSPWLLAAGVLLAVTGCSGKPQPPAGSPGSSGNSATAVRATESSCEGALTTIDEVFKLQNLGRTTRVSDGVLRLNDWQRTCAPADVAETWTPEIERLLTPEQLALVKESRFVQRDGEHLRDCLLDRACAGFAAGGGAAELDRVTSVFRYVVRAISLVPQPPDNLPLTTYEVCLFGKGTAEDRAWVFVNVLRQLRIDAVLIVPVGSNTAPGGRLSAGLVGVLLDNQVYLFEPGAGVPVPAPAGTARGPQVATWAQAVADPTVLGQLDVEGRPYPLTAASLSTADICVVADATFWSTRMQGLQTQFVGGRAMVLADPLGDAGESAPGALRRIAAGSGGAWDAARLQLWKFPEQRLAAHVAMSDEQQEVLAGQMMPFGAFKILGRNAAGELALVGTEVHEDRAGDSKVHPGVNLISRTTTGAQLRARVSHLEGNFAHAVREYLEVRDKCREVLRLNIVIPERVRHSQANEDAMYWTALCQFEQGETRAAINTLTSYRKRPEFTRWQREARQLLAVSLAAEGDFEAASATFSDVPADDPERAGQQVLIRQWRAAGEAAKN